MKCLAVTISMLVVRAVVVLSRRSLALSRSSAWIMDLCCCLFSASSGMSMLYSVEIDFRIRCHRLIA